MKPLINLYDTSIMTIEIGSTSEFYSSWVYIDEKKIAECHLYYEDGTKRQCALSSDLHKDKLAIHLLDVSMGYHCIVIKTRCGDYFRKTIFAYPSHCYLPDCRDGERALMVHLPSLRSDRNWGIGDYSDLNRLLEISKEEYQYIGVNPLHALDPTDMKKVSPYSPDSRVLFNEMFLDVEGVAKHCKTKKILKILQSPELQKIFKNLRSFELIQYSKIYSIKILFLKIIFYDFQKLMKKDSSIAQPFQEFCLSMSNLEKKIVQQRSKRRAEFFDNGQISEDLFEAFLQWQCLVQLSALKSHGKPKLYLDIAIGSQVNSSDQRATQGAFDLGKSLGVPPDEFCKEGQNWNIVPLSIEGLRQSEYQYFRQIISAHMKFSGMLRIDHIAGLMRRYILPYHQYVGKGVYEETPFKEFMAILSIESHRHHCIVVGEDLGTVPEELRALMQNHQILHCCVYMLEAESFSLGTIDQMRLANSAFSYSTHDLPSLAAFTTNFDISLRVQLGLLRDDDAKSIILTRNYEKKQYFSHINEVDMFSVDSRKEYLVSFTQAHMARVYVFSLDDLIGENMPINIPGTDKEYPNWCRKYRHALTVDHIQL